MIFCPRSLQQFVQVLISDLYQGKTLLTALEYSIGDCSMNIVEHNVDGDPQGVAEDLLSLPLFCFVGMLTTEGNAPRVSPLWYLWENDAIWILGDSEESHTTRLAHHPQVAVAIVDFEATAGRLQHIGMRGSASFEPYDGDRALRLLSQYLGPEPANWDPDMFTDPRERENDRWTFVRISPTTVVLRDFSYDASNR